MELMIGTSVGCTQVKLVLFKSPDIKGLMFPMLITCGVMASSKSSIRALKKKLPRVLKDRQII